MKKLLVTLLACAAVPQLHAADTAGLQISLMPDLALQDQGTPIHGLTLNIICGLNPQQGLTFGLWNSMSDESAGFSWGLVNYADTYTGVHWGLLNLTQKDFSGWQDGVINYTARDFTGLQSGVINVAGHCTGLQFGVFNYSDKLTGLQIGALNITAQNHWFNHLPNQFAACFPIVNWSF